jgi:hypothetical protein
LLFEINKKRHAALNTGSLINIKKERGVLSSKLLQSFLISNYELENSVLALIL